MALLEVRTEWAVYKNCFLQVAKYQADNSRAIEIWNEEDGPIARITVCITGSMLAEDEVVLDTNNCPWAVEFVESNDLGENTGRTVRSSRRWQVLNISRITTDKVRRHSPESFGGCLLFALQEILCYMKVRNL